MRKDENKKPRIGLYDHNDFQYQDMKGLDFLARFVLFLKEHKWKYANPEGFCFTVRFF